MSQTSNGEEKPLQEIALKNGEIKPGAFKASLLREKDEDLTDYITQLKSFNRDLIDSGRWPSIMSYDGPGGIDVAIFGISSLDDITLVFKKSWNLFEKTNVNRVTIKFYKSEKRVSGPEGTWSYVPTDLLFAISSTTAE